MDIRDEFAAWALGSIIAVTHSSAADDVARLAYQQADAMMARRNRSCDATDPGTRIEAAVRFIDSCLNGSYISTSDLRTVKRILEGQS